MAKILAVATNDATNLNEHKTGLWLSELTHFLHEIVAAGHTYDLASPKGGKIPLDELSMADLEKDPMNAKFIGDPRFVELLEKSVPCASANPSDYAAIFLSGGHGTMFDFRGSKELQSVITALYSAGRPVSGVCHGVSGFIDSMDDKGQLIVKGKSVTGFSNFEDTLAGVRKLMPFLLEDALKANGANYARNLLPFTERVETDGVLITGQNPQSAKGVGKRVVEALAAGRLKVGLGPDAQP
jgi:putative intracellular protease/amidase